MVPPNGVHVYTLQKREELIFKKIDQLSWEIVNFRVNL